MSMRLLSVGGGRTLAYEEAGDPAGAPLFLSHGTPGCRLSARHPDLARVRAAGLRLVTYDRPGYGHSTRQPERRVVDCVEDVAAIAEALVIERFSIAGISGGGPHALAVAARLSERVTRAACIVGAAPFDAEDLDWVQGMDPVNVKELEWALAGEETLARELEREAQTFLARVDADPTALFEGIELSDSDRAVLSDPAFRASSGVTTKEMFAGGVWGWVDDDLACIKPWGFELAELRVPVEVRYGAGDVLVPARHGEWLAAHIPGAVVHVDEDRGHLLTPDERLRMLQAFALA